MNNVIMRISPYLDNGVWVFDDTTTGLVKEPFVSGMPEIFREMVGERRKFTALFSEEKFPGVTHTLTWLYPEYGGNWYSLTGTQLAGWLCPALFKYFTKAPVKIYIQVLP